MVDFSGKDSEATCSPQTTIKIIFKKITCKNKTLLHLDHHMHGNAPLQVLYFWKQQPQQCKLLAQLTTDPLECRISTLDLDEFVRLCSKRTQENYAVSDKRHKSKRK